MHQYIKSLTLVLGVLPAMPSAAQDASELSYEDSMQCSALFNYMSVSLEGVGDEDSAAAHNIAIRWAALAIVRDGEEGAKLERDLEPATMAIARQFEAKGNDEAAVQSLMEGFVDRCIVLGVANREEFDAVDLSEGE